jgi:hypothetical protein
VCSSDLRPKRKQIRKTPRKTSNHKKSKSKMSKRVTKLFKKKKHNAGQNGGFKTCSLGYAMVKGMNIPAINNVEGEVNFNDVYARLNSSGNCKLAGNGVNHPVLQT